MIVAMYSENKAVFHGTFLSLLKDEHFVLDSDGNILHIVSTVYYAVLVFEIPRLY